MMLCLLMLGSTAMTTSCGTSEEERAAQTLQLGAVTTEPVTLTIWGIKGEGTTDKAIELVEQKMNELTKAKYNTAIELKLLSEDEYREKITDYLEDNKERYEKEEAAKKAARRAGKGNKTDASETTAAETAKSVEIKLDKNGLPIVTYPKVADDHVDIFLITDYEMLMDLEEREVLASLDDELNNSSKVIKEYIHGTLLEAGMVNGSTVAILNQQQAGKATYMLIDKEKLQAAYDAETDATKKESLTIEYIAEYKIRNAVGGKELGQSYFRNARDFIIASAKQNKSNSGFEALKGDLSPVAVQYFITEEDKENYVAELAAYEEALVKYEEDKIKAAEAGVAPPAEPEKPTEPRSIFGSMLNTLAHSYGDPFVPSLMISNLAGFKSDQTIDYNPSIPFYQWLLTMKQIEIAQGYDKEIETVDQLVEEGNFSVAIIKGSTSDVAKFEKGYIQYTEDNLDLNSDDNLPPYYVDGDKYYVLQIQGPVAEQSEIYNGAFAVSAYTSDVSRSMEIITYLNTKSEIRDLFGYGVEGTHYEIDDQGALHRLNNEYNMALEYTGNTFIAHAPEGVVTKVDTDGDGEYETIDYWEDKKRQNLTLELDPFFGFKMTESDVDMEYYEAALEISEEFYAEWDALTAPNLKDADITAVLDKYIEMVNADINLRNWISENPDFSGNVITDENGEVIQQPDPITLYQYYNDWFNTNIY